MYPKSRLMLGSVTLALSGCHTFATSVSQELAYVGTQNDGEAEGVVAVRLDETNGALTTLGVVARVDRPTWVLVDKVRKRMFAVSEVGNDGSANGAVFGFSFDPGSGALRSMGRAESGGGGPTQLALAAGGAQVFVANYGSGTVAAIAVDARGRIAAEPASIAVHEGSGPHRRQKGPHAHGVTVDPSGRYLLSADLGTDRVYVYRLGNGGKTLTPSNSTFVALPPGFGPRHIVFAPDGKHAFLMTEMGGTIFSYRWDARKGVLTEIFRQALDTEDFTGVKSGSELTISRDGRFLYAGNRAANRIQVYAVGPSGALRLLEVVDCGGLVPWSFSLSGSGRWMVVANQGSNNLSVFAVDRVNGRLSATGKGLDLGKPTSVSFTDR